MEEKVLLEQCMTYLPFFRYEEANFGLWANLPPLFKKYQKEIYRSSYLKKFIPEEIRRLFALKKTAFLWRFSPVLMAVLFILILMAQDMCFIILILLINLVSF